jgi:hypothetical protein
LLFVYGLSAREAAAAGGGVVGNFLHCNFQRGCTLQSATTSEFITPSMGEQGTSSSREKDTTISAPLKCSEGTCTGWPEVVQAAH